MQVIRGAGVRRSEAGQAMAERVRRFAYSEPVVALGLYSKVYGPFKVPEGLDPDTMRMN